MSEAPLNFVVITVAREVGELASGPRRAHNLRGCPLKAQVISK